MSKIISSQLAAGCTGKKAHRTYWRAFRAAKCLNRQRDNARCHTYRCDYCPFWHVGNNLPKATIKEFGGQIWV